MNRIVLPAQAEANPSPRGGRSARIQEPPPSDHRGYSALRGLFLLAAALLLASCITIPRPASDEDVCYAPSLDGYDYFWYFSSADPFLSLDSKRAEIIRLERFRKWLVRNGYETPRIEVVSRKVEERRKVLGMTVYDLRYLVKVKQPGGEEEPSKETTAPGATGEAGAEPREDTQQKEESAQGKDPAQMKGGAAQESAEPGIQVEKVPPEELDPAAK